MQERKVITEFDGTVKLYEIVKELLVYELEQQIEESAIHQENSPK